MGCSGDREPATFPAQLLQGLLDQCLPLVLGHDVDLVEDQPLVARGEFVAERLQFATDGLDVGHDVRAVRRQHVDQMQHQARSLQMLEKADAETGTFGGALRSEAHKSELQSLMRISYAVFFLIKKY